MPSGPTSPKALLQAFVAALTANDADAIAELYDDNAAFIFPALNFRP
ncbi:MAG TPA: nuclear transport factor 2 family protein [Myxococcota bacterium]|nr:nuclear transport factor 2 family protein [Myxococcota bacterium]